MVQAFQSKPIHGVLLLNKPSGLTSNAYLQLAKRLYQAKKAGHTGSLDPLATGMLPICFGEACKFSQFLLDQDKAYIATGLLGIETDTGDSEGNIISETPFKTVDPTKLTQVLPEFRGAIQQTPPRYAALKYEGRPLYYYARKGIDIPIELKTRLVTIYDLQCLAFDGKSFTLEVKCSKGTYIRSLVQDIGSKLGLGAHVTQLHRQYTAGFEAETMYSLEELKSEDPDRLMEKVLPIDETVKHLPALELTSEATQALFQGKTIAAELYKSHIISSLPSYIYSPLETPPHDNNASIPGVLYRLYLSKNKQFLGLGCLSETYLKPYRLVSQEIVSAFL